MNVISTNANVHQKSEMSEKFFAQISSARPTSSQHHSTWDSFSSILNFLLQKGCPLLMRRTRRHIIHRNSRWILTVRLDGPSRLTHALLSGPRVQQRINGDGLIYLTHRSVLATISAEHDVGWVSFYAHCVHDSDKSMCAAVTLSVHTKQKQIEPP